MKIKENTAKIIFAISTFVILIVLAYFIYTWANFNFPEFYTFEDKMYEYTTILFHLPFLLPAIIGLSNRNKNQLLILIGYVIYLLLAILCYSSILWADDPLAAGMFFVLFGLPYSIVFSLFLLLWQIRKS